MAGSRPTALAERVARCLKGNCCSIPRRWWTSSGQAVLQPYLDAVIAGDLTGYLSVITEAEHWRGLRADEVERHEALIAHFTCLPLDSVATRQAGAWMQRYESRGLGWMAALIVATARRADLAVLTRDLHLARCLQGEADFQTYTLTPNSSR